MGFLNKLLGKEKEYPALEDASPEALRMNKFRHELEDLVKDVNDPLEIIPTDDTAYVFIGKPPKKFGMAWIKDGRIYNFKTLAQEKNVPEMKILLMSEKLREAYEHSREANRFSTSIADHKITVTRSDSLKQDLERIIEQ